MNISKFLQKLRLSDKGSSLIELTVVAGVMSLVAFGTSFTIQQNIVGSKVAERKASFSDTASLFQIALSNQTEATGSCTDLIEVAPGASFNPNDQTNIRISLFGETVEEGYTPADGSYRVEKLYIDDAELLGVDGTNANYTASIYMEASVRQNNQWNYLPRQKLTSISTKINAGGGIENCDLQSLTISAKSACDTIIGMFWNEAEDRCQEVITTDGNGCFEDCGAMQRIPGTCKCAPEENSGTCEYEQILPQNFYDGSFKDCSKVPPTHYVVHKDPGVIPEPILSNTPPPKCGCGSSNINQNEYCVACRVEDNCYNGWESCYYYTVYQCNKNPSPSSGAGGSLDKIIGPYTGGTYKDKSDPPSGYGCVYQKKKGAYIGGKYYQRN